MFLIEKMYDEYWLLAELQYEYFMEDNPNFKKTKSRWFLDGYFDSVIISHKIVKKAINYLLVAKTEERKNCLRNALRQFCFTYNVSNKEVDKIYKSLTKI